MSENMYKIAAMRKLRFVAPMGQVRVEDLFDLSLQQLDAIATDLKGQIEDSQKSTLFESKASDFTLQVRYDIVADVFKTKQESAKAAEAAEAKRQRNARIREILAGKTDEALNAKSEEELLALLEE